MTVKAFCDFLIANYDNALEIVSPNPDQSGAYVPIIFNCNPTNVGTEEAPHNVMVLNPA